MLRTVLDKKGKLMMKKNVIEKRMLLDVEIMSTAAQGRLQRG